MALLGSDWLAQRMAQFAGGEAVVCGAATCGSASIGYGQLHGLVAQWRRDLDASGFRPGAVIAVSPNGAAAIPLLLALVGGGYIAALLPGDGEDPQRYLGPACADARLELQPSGEWLWATLDPRQPPPPLRRLRQRGNGGLVVFSSGTTGECKAALFDFTALIRRYREPRRGQRTLLFLRLDHLGGVHTMLHTLAHGGTLVISDDRHADAVCAAIERHRVELLPATPTFLRMLVLSGAYRRHDLSSLRLITYGTEPMPAATLRALTAAFPATRFKQTYGLSELGVLPTRSKAAHSLWLQVGSAGCATRIVDNVLWIRSETAMLGYLNAPSPFDEDGWYNTEDAVEIDGPYLRILGRTTDLINVGGQKVYPAEVENILLEMDNVREATVWGHSSPVTGQIVAARLSLAQPEDPDALEQRLHRFCRGRLAAHKVPLYIEIVDGAHHGPRFKKIRPDGRREGQWPARSS